MSTTVTQIWDNRPWTLLRADPNMAPDVLINAAPTTLTLKPAKYPKKKDGFAVAQVNSGDVSVCFAESYLEPQGSQVPNLGTAGLEPLPVYVAGNNAHEAHYVNALDHSLIPYLASNPDLMRLEGTIKIRCPWPRTSTPDVTQAAGLHYVETDVKLYQFERGISNDPNGNTTLLVIWAPDSPRLPTNPDGTALGVG